MDTAIVLATIATSYNDFKEDVPCLRLDWKSSMIKHNPNPSPIEKTWFELFCFGGGGGSCLHFFAG